MFNLHSIHFLSLISDSKTPISLLLQLNCKLKVHFTLYIQSEDNKKLDKYTTTV